MIWWVLKILNINGDLDRLCEKIDERIAKLAFNSVTTAAALYEKIAELNAKKADLINLRVLYNMMADALSEDELNAALSAAKNTAASELDEVVATREEEVVLKKCAKIAVESGFHSKRLERIYPYLSQKMQAA